MQLLYADESGNVTDQKQKYFVLAGFSVFERQSWWLSKELDLVAARFNSAEIESIELHGSPMLQGRGKWRKIEKQKRIDALVDCLKIFKDSHNENRIFACVINKENSEEDPVYVAFEQLLSRFDQYLMRLHRLGDTQRGIVIFDKSSYESSFQYLTTQFRVDGHSFGVIRNFAEVPLFIDSKASRMIQMADIIAYSIFRKFEKNDERFYDIIKDKFDNQYGTNHGLFIQI